MDQETMNLAWTWYGLGNTCKPVSKELDDEFLPTHYEDIVIFLGYE